MNNANDMIYSRHCSEKGAEKPPKIEDDFE